ncbi:MAG TPA: amidohydrolase, partial [Woeseiaceae bacterium]|nr:amidohydrolase [Woeseiaceae bacterium]
MESITIDSPVTGHYNKRVDVMIHRQILVALGASLLTVGAGAAEKADEQDEWDVNAPPGNSRQIDINTSSGTWMSLDVSPDGRTVAFDLLGDIYVVSIDGGSARALDSGLSWSMQPRFSPDGSRIAYTSDAGGGDNIWIMRADGSEKRQLTKEDFRLLNNPTWSPDGKYIAARKHFTTTRSLGTGEVWLYHVLGGDGIAVVEKPDEKHQKELGEPAFSPDGRYIYFSVDSTPGGTFVYAQDSNKQIFEIRRHDLERGTTETVVGGPGGAVRPEPSPDGSRLAFVRRHAGRSALFVKDLVSGAEEMIFDRLDQDLQEVWGVHGLYPNMDWNPDSKSLVFWASGGIHRIDVSSRGVSEIPFEVDDRRTVFAAPRPAVDVAPAEFDSRMVRHAAVSPDGSRVVFEVTGRLYAKSLPDGQARWLTSDSEDRFEYFPSWSRDGRRIVFVTWDDRELAHIHTVSATGGRSTRVTERPGHYRAPRYSPDGTSIVFEATDGSYLTAPEWSMETGVFAIAARGGTARRITDDGANPHFGAADDRLFVTRDAEDARALVSIDLNGESARTHATGQYLAQFEVAPDGRHLAFRENYHVYVLPLPPGGKPLELGTSVSSVTMTRASGNGGNYPHWSADGRTLYWSLGPVLFASSLDEIFTVADEDGEGGYKAPEDGVSLGLRLRADRPQGSVALVGAKIVTMTDENGGVIEDGVILTDGHRIAAVGAAGDIEIPANARRVDVSGKTIIPGLIDAHAHGAQGDDIIPRQNWVNYATLALGVTTVHDPSNDATEVFAAAEMQRTGAIL